MLLSNKIAIVTGGGSGFGKATCLLFAQEGAKVAVVDFNIEAAQAVAESINQDGGKAIAIKADVSDEDQVKNFVNETVEAFGGIDILFNNAGIYVPGNVEETDLSGLHKSVNVNIDGVFLGIKYAIPYLKESKGSIINTASAAARIGFPGAVSYAATKGAVVSLTQAVAVDYASHGVRANCISPGTGHTGMTEELLKDPAIEEAFLAPIPLRRLGQPEDVAGAALFLASDYSNYITGAIIPVDGGWTMS